MDWKKVVFELLKQLFAFARRCAEKSAQILSGLRGHPYFKPGVVVIAVSLTLGYFLGFLATHGRANPNGLSLFHLVQGAKTSFPGTQADGSFVFSNFENPQDVRSWNLVAARMKPSSDYAWEGSSSAEVSFSGVKEFAAIAIEALGRGAHRPSNWSQYESVQFHLFQRGPSGEQLTFLVTDLWGKRFEEVLNVPGGQWTKFAIPVSKMAEAINVKQVNQLSISKRNSEAALDFYLDDLRLIRSAVSSTGTKPTGLSPYGFEKRKAAWTTFDPQVNGEIVRIPFIVKNETGAFCHLCPAEGGVPFPAGELRDTKMLRLRNAQGEDLPFQARVLAHWPDQSIKWLALSFQSTLNPGDGAGYFLEYGSAIRSMDFTSPLTVTEDRDMIRIDTGVLEATFSKKAYYLFDRVSVDQNRNGTYESTEEMTSRAELTLLFGGKEFRTSFDTKTYQLAVEEKGAQRVVVKATGWFQAKDGQRFCQATLRYYFYQGKSEIRLSHTLIYTGYPENKQYAAYKMLKLPPNEMIEAYGIRIPYPFQENKKEQLFLGLNRMAPLGINVGNTLELSQKNYDSWNLKRDGEAISTQDSFAGWFDLSNDARGIAISLRDFRENFPKAIKIDRRGGFFDLELWPKEAGPIDLSTTEKAVGPNDYGRGNAFGLAKTHEVMLYFHSGNAADSNSFHTAASFSEPVLIRSNPYWIDATGALGRLFPSDPKYATEEQMLERLFDWADRQPRMFGWYGALNFGDTLSWWRDQDGKEDGEHKYSEKGWHPIGRWGWYNCEGVGTHTGALLQFARSGMWKYFEFGGNLARHVMDVDTIHYNTIANDKRVRRLLNEKYSYVGAMHRHSGDHWSGRTDEASHTSVVGILIYYFLTGNERALDVAKEVGEYFLREPFTYIGHPDVAPNRAMANALWGDVLLYQVTGEERYKKAADKIVKIFLKGQQPDGSFLENYNPILRTWKGEKHELYMAGYILGALIAYHELTQDEAVKEMLLKLVRYLSRLEFTAPTILHGLGYAYLLTKDPFFIMMAQENLKSILAHQQLSNDPLMDGLIYDKQIYHRPMTFLSTVPYVFGALEEYFEEQANGPRR